MVITSIKTRKITSGSISLFKLLDLYLKNMEENSILAITSKIVSLCESNTIPIGSINKEDLVKQQSTYYLPTEINKYGYRFTITNNTLIASAGIDKSNGNGDYILWPKAAQASANQVRKYLIDRFKLNQVGVIITDSTSRPTRFGTIGISVSHSGFKALENYVGQPDLFGNKFSVTRANIAEGLAASAAMVMGEGRQQTPLALISDVAFVKFQSREPSKSELEELKVNLEDDFFAPFLNKVNWQKGEKT